MTTVARDLREARGPLLFLAIVDAIAVSCLLLGAAVASEPILAVAGLVLGIAGLAIALRPDNATVVVVFLIYSNAAVVAVVQHGVPAIAAVLVPLLLTVPLGYALLVRRQPVVVTPSLPWIIGLLLVQIVGTVFARDPSDAAAELGTFVVEGVALYILVTNTLRTMVVLRQVVWALLLVGSLLGGLSLYQEVTHSYGNDFLGFAQTESSFGTGQQTLAGEIRQARQAGPIGEKNRYGQVMLMLVPIALFQAWSERRRLLRVAALGAAVLAGAGTILTFSRGAAVGFVLMIVIMAALRYIRPRQLLVMALGIVLLIAVVPEYATRVASLETLTGALSEDASLSDADTSLLSRATENLTALNVFADHMLVGVGPGQFSSYYREYSADIGVAVRAEDREAHNLYLGIAADAGLLGLICFLAILFTTLRQLARARSRWLVDRPEVANMATGFMLAIVTYMTTGLFLHLSYARYFWLMAAISGAVAAVALALPAVAAALPVVAGRDEPDGVAAAVPVPVAASDVAAGRVAAGRVAAGRDRVAAAKAPALEAASAPEAAPASVPGAVPEAAPAEVLEAGSGADQVPTARPRTGRRRSTRSSAPDPPGPGTP